MSADITDITQAIRLLPESERAAVLLAWVEAKRAEAEVKRAEAEAKLAEVKADTARRLADIRRVAEERLKTRSFADALFVIATVVAIAWIIVASLCFRAAQPAAKTGTVFLFALFGIVLGAGFQFVHGLGVLDSQIKADILQLVHYVDIAEDRTDALYDGIRSLAEKTSANSKKDSLGLLKGC
ncbi:uncharacterized protein EV422DRAFT_319576 [Fimicolochytrium jonesii]|uniref:uncharacterized protein n=1 Tax=Fimicolochytrium jonesii TaxID=1396493 RepID=UPI0022FE4172|nr:uncharacterized protein EV422DRAFT_319576 [Fimicolochytrium jonesii]KAI8824412.1 hypothetical protein EV422DRAFT_319576 [Fimicolochytrium jonesii]